jgi:hypothetical protein
VAATASETQTLELLAWLAAAPRTYGETLEVWRSSCPRLTIWEDAVHERLVAVRGRAVHVTAKGREMLRGDTRRETVG